jgi:Tfp pilus assembly protein PilO
VLRRVLKEQRRYLVPLAIVLAVNVGVLVGVVYPLDARVSAASSRAATADQARRRAQQELNAAQAVATGKSRAEAELKTFYGEVLPLSVSAANRATYLPIAQLIRRNNLQRTRSTTHVTEVRESALEKLEIALTVEGNYEDLRRFIYDLETAPFFVVIDSIGIEQGREPGKPVVLNLGLATYYRAANHGS